MKKDQQNIVLEEMKRTVRNIRDAAKNSDTCYSPEAIKNNMLQYFSGLAYAKEMATGNEYHWSNGENGNEWTVVIYKNGKERRYQV